VERKPVNIEHVEERRRLAVLLAERGATSAGQEAALAPLDASFRDAQLQAELEFVAAGGVTIEAVLTKQEGLPAFHDPTQVRLRKERDAKWAPHHAALEEMRKAFEQRLGVIDTEIDAIQHAIGGKVAENYWTGEGEPAFCSITGLPILDSDEILIVLAGAITPAASSS